MNPFTKHTGLVAALDRIDVDTDQLIPKEFLKRIERTGFGQFLFNDWRFRENNELNPDFELNHPAFEGATILLARRNFGCGSSREHAVWALADYGFRVLISVSFADIFYNNCFENGVLPVTLDDETVERLFARTSRMDGYRLTVDLQRCRVSDEEGLDVPFQIDGFRRECLLNGWDSIALTLQHSDEIARFEAARGDR